MSGDATGRTSKIEQRTDWRRLRAMTDAEVHAAVLADPEIKPTDEAFWKAARVIAPQSANVSKKRRRPMPLIFRPEVHFDPQNDDAFIWGDEGSMHFRLVIRRALLLRKYGLKRYFDQPGAEAIIKGNRTHFEKLAQKAYEVGASEIILG